MKKTFRIMVMASAMGLVACGGDAVTEEVIEATTEEASEEVTEVVEEAEKASIVGTWQMTEMDMGITPPPGKEEEFKAAMKESIDQTKYTFNEDGSMVINSMLGEQKGTYSVDGDVLTSNLEGKEESIEIGELTTNKLVLLVKSEEINGSMTFKK